MDHRWTPAPATRGLGSVVVLVAVMVVAGAATTSSPLHALTYPPEGSNVLTSADFVERWRDALTTASVLTETSPRTVVENERTRLTATLVLGVDTPEDAEPSQVEVAWDNEATLRADDKGTIEISPSEPVQKSLAECRPREGGGCSVSWSWTIIPRRTGTQTLLLTVEPLVFVDGQRSDRFKRRNADIPITVLVHPARESYTSATAALGGLVLDVPAELTSGHSYTVTASLPRSWPHPDLVAADLALDAGQGSPPTVVTDLPGPGATGAEVRRSWLVTPSGAGVLRLDLTATLGAQAGDEALEQSTTTTTSVAVSPTFWEGVDSRVKWLGGVVSLALGVVGVWRVLPWMRRRPVAARGESEEP